MASQEQEKIERDEVALLLARVAALESDRAKLAADKQKEVELYTKPPAPKVTGFAREVEEKQDLALAARQARAAAERAWAEAHFARARPKAAKLERQMAELDARFRAERERSAEIIQMIAAERSDLKRAWDDLQVVPPAPVTDAPTVVQEPAEVIFAYDHQQVLPPDAVRRQRARSKRAAS